MEDARTFWLAWEKRSAVVQVAAPTSDVIAGATTMTMPGIPSQEAYEMLPPRSMRSRRMPLTVMNCKR